MSDDLVLRQRFWQSMNAVMLVVVTAVLILFLFSGRAGWLPILVAAAVLGLLWWAGVRDVQVSGITVTATHVESRHLFGTRSVARHEVTAIDAHPGQFSLWGPHGIVLRLRPVWSRAEMETLARELGVRVCFEPGPGCPRQSVRR